MSGSVTLLMAVHSHQPVGNFGFVFEEAYAKAYDPFLCVLERHPEVHLSLHYSGCLLDWLLEHRPEFIRRVRTLVAKGQVELLASGYYEPILPLIPEPDRQGQIAQMRDALRTHFGAESTGLWLTERVWEPDLPATLARAGIRYTMVDANQFAAARPWLPRAMQIEDETFWDLLGCYSTEYTGSSILLFPASKRLRYWMPFQAVERTVDFLRRLRRDEPVTVTFADDGEKFGLWPKTYRWVYDEGWLDQFFGALERERAWLTTATFQDSLRHAGPQGNVYLPCGSYEEMLEWSGGSFRNFFTKYPEANAMQQKMLRISGQIRSCPPRVPRTGKRSMVTVNGKRFTVHEALNRAARELYTAQCNCAYWHGVFGGLYLTHLRRAVYAHLIAADQLVQEAARQAPVPRRASPRQRAALLRQEGVATEAADVDGDGYDELTLRTPAMQLVVDPTDGGTVTEWSLYGPRINLLDTLSRRPEPYHEQLRARQAQPAAATGQGVASIHEALGVKEEHLESYLTYDDHRRSGFLDYALQGMPALQDVARSTWGERRLWPSGPCRWEASAQPAGASRSASVTLVRDAEGTQIRKTVRVLANHAAVDCLYELTGHRVPVIALEFNVALRDERYLHQAQQLGPVTRFEIAEPAAGVSLRAFIEPAAMLMHFPVETVSESEGGLERTYQGLCVVCFWRLDGTASWKSRVQWTVGKA